jgi:zinc transporter ZupT
MTAIGARFVFLTNRVDRRLLDGMLGFSPMMLLDVAFS